MIDARGVDFASVTMTLVDLFLLAIKLAETGPLGALLEDCGTETEAHGAARVVLSISGMKKITTE